MGVLGYSGPMREGTVVGWDPDEHFVYELRDDDGTVFYVGKTNCPQGRLKQHIRGSGNRQVTDRLRAAKKPPMVIVAGPMSEFEAIREERRRIKNSTTKLLNCEHWAKKIGQVHERHPLVSYFMTHGVKTPEI